MKKRILSLLLVIVMMVGMLPTTVFAAEAVVYSPDHGDADTHTHEGDAWHTVSGEEEEALSALSKDSDGNYLIEDADDLRDFAALVNGGTAPANAVLTQNINLGNQSWTPIGSLAHPYSGHFDGRGYTISGLKIDGAFANDPTKANGLNPGLFGNIQSAGIRNLTVSGSNTATISVDNTLSTVVGSALLVGHMTDAIVYNCYAKGSVTGAAPYNGGLAGIAQHSIIINCGSEATVQASGIAHVGGLVGTMTAGYDSPLCLLNSWCTGNVTAGNSGYVGGLVGYLADDAVNNYFSGTITSQGAGIGQLFGYVANGIKATPDAESTTTFTPVIEKNYYKSGSGDAIGSAAEGLNTSGFGKTYSDLNTLRRTMNSNLPEVEKIIDGHRGYLSTTQWAELVSLLNGEDVKAFHWQNGDSNLYLQDQHVCDTNGLCECGNGYAPNAVAVLSKNGKDIFAGTTLDAVITEAEKCAAGDKAVVTILQNIDLGTANYQEIGSGVFTIDLNGYKISYDHVNYSTLRINNAGTDITLISSRPGGTVENRRYNGRAIMTGRNTNLTATGISVITGNEGYAIYLNGSATLSDVTVPVSEDGIHIQNTAKEHEVTLICTNCTVQATEIALFVSDDCTATITGGSLTGGDVDITAVGSVTVAGTAFPGGIKTTHYHTLNEILAEGYAYWAGDTMLSVADEVWDIMGKGDITVKAACTHEQGEKSYVNNGEDHTYTLSCCNSTVVEDHTFTGTTCICGARDHDCRYTNGFCDKGCYQPAELVDGYYQITNGGQLFWFAEKVNSGENAIHAILTADIDLENRAWTPMGTEGSNAADGFRGTFDGNGKTIRGLKVTAADHGVGFMGEVRNGTVKDFTIYGEVEVNGRYDYVGGVIGSACGTSDDVGATISGITSYVNVTLGEGSHGSNRVAGLIGYVNHKTNVENCVWHGTLDLGPYRAQDGVGGLIGKAHYSDKSHYSGTIRNCAAYGTIKTSYQSGSYNDFDTIYIGGILSNSVANAKTVIENTLWAGTIVNETNLGAKAHISAFGTMNGFHSITNCYALNNAPYITTNGTHDSHITAVTADQLASGEIACKLGDAWGQTIDEEDVPVLGGRKVYQAKNCKDEPVYGNTNADIGHNWVNGVCTVCGTPCEHADQTGETCSICGTALFVNGFAPDGGYQPAEQDENGVYLIGNAGQLYWFAQQVNGGNTAINGKLTADIVVNENVLNADGSLNEGEFRPWTPMGRSLILGETGAALHYVGTFDGDGHTISGLYFNDSAVRDVGLFGSTDGIVQNVGIVDTYFHGDWSVGSIAGYNPGTITNCYNTGSISGDYTVGGIAGRSSNGCPIVNCWNTGKVSGNSGIGGITSAVLLGGDPTTNCYYLDTCGAAGKGTATSAAQFASGEIAYKLGEAFGQTIGSEAYPIFGGATVYQVTCGGEGTVYRNVNESYAEHIDTDGICSICGTAVFVNGFCSNGTYQPAEQDENGVYLIGNAGQLYWFAQQVTNGQNAINGKLTADIVVNENVLKEDGTPNEGSFREWTPAGNGEFEYSGTFDGDGHTISGLYYHREDFSSKKIGLFSGISETGTVQNVGIVDSWFCAYLTVGSIAGYSHGTIKNCYNAGSVSAISYFGGITSENWGTIANCHNTGRIINRGSASKAGGIVGYNYHGTITNCCNTGSVTANDTLGGIAGDNRGTVENCYNTGNITSIRSTSMIGGIAGFNQSDGSIANCHSIGNISLSSGLLPGSITNRNEGTVTNSYYLNTNGETEAGTAASVAQFASGEIAYKLGEAFGQTIGSEAYPVLGGTTVYAVTCGGEGTVYSNTNENIPAHSYVDHRCVTCGLMEDGWYTITVPEDIGYVIPDATSLTASHSLVQAGETVTVELTATIGYRIRSLTALCDDETEILCTTVQSNQDSTHIVATFTMPAQNVTLNRAEIVPQSQGPIMTLQQTGEGTVTLPVFGTDSVHRDTSFTVIPADPNKTPAISVTSAYPLIGESELFEIPWTDNGDGTYTIPIGSNTVHSDMIITVNFNGYEAELQKDDQVIRYIFLADALRDAGSRDSVTLLQDVTLTESVSANIQTLNLSGKTLTLADGCRLDIFAADVNGSDGIDSNMIGTINGNTAGGLVISPDVLNRVTITNSHADGYAVSMGGSTDLKLPATGVTLNGEKADLYLGTHYNYVSIPNGYEGKPISVAAYGATRLAYNNSGEVDAAWFTAADDNYVVWKDPADPQRLSLRYDIARKVDVSLSATEIESGGSAPAVIVTGDLTEGTDYTIHYYRDGVETTDLTETPGEVTVKLMGTGSYGGQIALVYTVAAAQVTVDVSAEPAEGGTVSGGGTYEQSTAVTVTAVPAEGYRFVNWTAGGTEVSTNASYTFTATADCALVANFEKIPHVAAVTVNGVTTEHFTIHDALTAAQAAEGAVLTLLADVAESIRIESGSLTLDLSGHTLSANNSSYCVEIGAGANVVITDSSEDKTGTISGKHMWYEQTQFSTVGVIVKGTCTIEGGTILDCYVGAEVSGTCNVKGGSITGINRCLDVETGSAEIHGGTITGGDAGLTVSNGTIRIIDGTITANGKGVNIYSDSTVEIINGTITGNVGLYVYGDGSRCIIRGGTITATGTGVQTDGIGAYCEILGGTISARIGVTVDGSEVIIGGGTITATDNGVSIKEDPREVNSTCTITGGTIEANTGVNLSNGTCSITGGSISGVQNAIRSYDACTVTGGTFTGPLSGSAKYISISGGTFSADPTQWVMEGHEAALNSETNLYTVVPKFVCDHSGNETVDDKDCTTAFTCSVCGETLVEAKDSHAFSVEVKDTRVDATCMAEGSVTMQCAACEVTEVQTLDIDPDNHTGNNHVEGKTEASCGEPGYTGDTFCECGALITKGEATEPTGEHNYTTEVEGSKVPATCMAEGSVTMQCGCGATEIRTLDIDPDNHAESTYTYIDNRNHTHSAVYACCEVVYLTNEPHDFSYDAENHKCICGAAETTVTLTLIGPEMVNTSTDSATYTVTAKDMINLGTVLLKLDIPDHYLTDPVVKAIGENWIVISQVYENGELTVLLSNLSGAYGEEDIFTLQLTPTENAGNAVVSVTAAQLTVCQGDNSEIFVSADLSGASVTTRVEYSNIFDVNKDGIVNLLDMTRAQRFYGTNDAVADVDHNGEVTVQDLILILNNFYVFPA